MLKLPGSCQVHAVIGVLMDDTDPLVTVMKVERRPRRPMLILGGWTTKSRKSRYVWEAALGLALCFLTVGCWTLFGTLLL